MPAFARPNSAACAFGKNCNLETADMTFVLVLPDTVLVSFTTRDTVASETPASLATSLIVHGPAFWLFGAFAGLCCGSPNRGLSFVIISLILEAAGAASLISL